MEYRGVNVQCMSGIAFQRPWAFELRIQSLLILMFGNELEFIEMKGS